MAVRLAKRTGATERMAIATASWAMTAALIGECPAQARAEVIIAKGNLTTRLPDAGCEDLLNECAVLVGEPAAAVNLEGCAHLIETLASGGVNAFGLLCDRKESLGQVNGVGRWFLAVAPPICVKDFLGHFRRQ